MLIQQKRLFLVPKKLFWGKMIRNFIVTLIIVVPAPMYDHRCPVSRGRQQAASSIVCPSCSTPCPSGQICCRRPICGDMCIPIPGIRLPGTHLFIDFFVFCFFLYCPLFREGCGGSCLRLSHHSSQSSITSIILLG